MISGSVRAFRKRVLRGDRDPLRQHRQRAARLLVLRQRLPLALEDRERRRVERVARLEAALQELARLGLGRGRVHGGPLGRELRPPLEAPVAEGPGDVLPDLLAPEVLEEPPPDDLADLGLVVGDQVLGDAPHDLRDLVLPLLVPLGHLDLAARQADHAAPCVVPVVATVRFWMKAWNDSAPPRWRFR